MNDARDVNPTPARYGPRIRRSAGRAATALAVVTMAATLLLAGFDGEARATLAIGEPAPDFTLTDLAGTERTLSEYRGKVVVLEWFNFGCPFVRKHYGSGNMQALQREYTGKGVVWLAINSTRADHEDYRDVPQATEDESAQGAAPTAVLLDAEGTVGRRYDAKTTPHMFVVDAEGTLVYQGAIDSVRSTDADDIPKATNYVRQAVDEVLAGHPVSLAQTQPYGCSVKY